MYFETTTSHLLITSSREHPMAIALELLEALVEATVKPPKPASVNKSLDQRTTD